MVKKIHLQIILVLALTACHREQAPQDDHHDENIQLVAYSSDLELHAETTPLVLNEESVIIAHFTRLTDFKPVTCKKVIFNLVQGASRQTYSIEHTDTPGIYILHITPLKEGDAELLIEWVTDTLVHELHVPGLRVYPDRLTAREKSEHHHAGVNDIFFSKEQSWKIDFATAQPIKENRGPVIRAAGIIENSKSNEHTLIARASGIVQFAQNDLVAGKEVKQGETLFNVLTGEMPENNLALKLLEAENELARAQAAYQRMQLLGEENIAAAKDILEAKTAYENAKALKSSLSRISDRKGERVTSPVGGYIREIAVEHGNHVTSGQTLARVSRPGTLDIAVNVQIKYRSLLPGIREANLKGIDQTIYSLENLGGKVLSTGKATIPGQLMVPLYLRIPDHPAFVPGSIVEVYLKTASEVPVITLPREAILEEQGQFFVLVQEHPELFEKRPVRLGWTDGEKVEVISGLHPEERVITQGTKIVSLSSVSSELDPHAGHVH
jgi:membrane fusion protein, heavy metal efflux system